MKQHVSFFRASLTRSWSWVAFLMAIAILAGFWYICYWAIAEYAPGYLDYFTIGAYGACILGLIMLIFNEPIVYWTTSAKRVWRREDNPKLWDAVKRAKPMTLMFTPRIYVVPSWGQNAFAFGWGIPFFSAVAATEGIIKSLTDDELAAVMAHELGHIRNKDILVTMALAISVMIIGFTGWLLLRLGPYSSSGRSSSSKSSGGGWIILVVILVGVIMYGIGRGLGYVLQMFVSRQREYAADAASARVMGTSRPLISALQKISGHTHFRSTEADAAVGFLCTADPDPSDFLSTHPDMDKRLQALRNLEA